MMPEFDLEEFNKLSPEERKLALEILQQYATDGTSDLYNCLIDAD